MRTSLTLGLRLGAPFAPDKLPSRSAPHRGRDQHKSSPIACFDGWIMTTNKTAPVLCSLLLISSSAFAQPVQVTGDNVAFLYEARAELPVPDEVLAESAFTDYANARDEFARHDIFQRIKPLIAKRIAEARETTLVYLNVATDLEDYHFEGESFPTGFSDATFIPFRGTARYAVAFTNGADIEHLPVTVEVARSLATELRRTRRASATIYGEIQDVSEKTLNYLTYKTLNMRITKIEVSLRSGTVVGSKMLSPGD